MTRFAICFSGFLLSCTAVAQVPAPTPPPVQMPVTSASSPDMRQFQKIEDSWDDAVNRRDQYGLELVLSPLFLDVAASGDISTRNQQVAYLLTTEDKTLHLEQKVVTVRMLGDIAVANGTYVLHHRASSGQVDEKGVFTHVFERAHNGWLCINSQRTVLREDGGKSKKQSNADLPFHFPIFGKSEKKNE
ncbi:MAG TPA: nuclear transport factor 2 family protein [Terracidiphilus sp.]|nr:nuclear transport factor 2 family protein [Terracidiphilus sp.]